MIGKGHQYGGGLLSDIIYGRARFLPPERPGRPLFPDAGALCRFSVVFFPVKRTAKPDEAERCPDRRYDGSVTGCQVTFQSSYVPFFAASFFREGGFFCGRLSGCRKGPGRYGLWRQSKGQGFSGCGPKRPETSYPVKRTLRQNGLARAKAAGP